MKKKSFLPGFLIALFTVVAAVYAFIYFVGGYFYKFAIARKTNMKNIDDVSSSSEKEEYASSLVYDHTPEVNWSDIQANKMISIKSDDRLTLWGRVFENPDEKGECRKFGILCHGYRGHATDMGQIGEKFYEKGFSILLPSARGHDNSGGDYIGMGWPDRKDIVKWINRINVLYNNPEIFLFGSSMGGATVMYTAGEHLPSNVKCAFEDCGYSSIKEQFSHCLKDMMNLPVEPILSCAALTTKARAKYDFIHEGFTSDTLSRAEIPMFFSHGTGDTFVPVSMVYENYDAHPGPKEIYIEEGAVHNSVPYTAGDRYWNAVFEFLGRYISF